MVREEQFQGFAGRTERESQPWWVQPPMAAAGNPNVVYIVFDDMGFADLGCYGSEISTPNIDSLAANGLRYTNFHTTALCSPTRASLLTGRNHHSVGMAGLANWDMGYPGQRGRIARSAGTIAEMLRPHGYNTYAVGKWHLTPLQETSVAGPYEQWPTQRGFDRFYGFLEGETNQWHPELTEDNHHIEAPAGEGYHLTEDIVDRSIGFIRSQKSVAATKPFFLYMCFGAQHAPHHAPKEYIDKYVPVFEKGWDQTRQDRLARQKALGIVPPETVLPPSNDGVREWDSFSEDEKRLYVRFQAAFAGMLDHTDHHVGRFLDFLKTSGLFENTLIVLISDNGASQEGSPFGTVNALRYFNGVRDTIADNLPHIDEIGQGHLNNNYPLGWAMAGNTPLKRYKQNTHGGGVRDPLIVHWPKRIAGGGIRRQFHHVSDITPTVLESLGISPPAEINGVTQQPIEGTSFAYTWDAPAAPDAKRIQYFEMLGHRGIWAQGWKAVTFHRPGTAFEDDTWELYNVAEDFNETQDLASEHPEKLRELIDSWWIEAGKYNVLPLSGPAGRFIQRNPYAISRQSRWEMFPDTGRLPNAVCPDIRNRSYTITADVEIPEGGAEGALVAQGDWCGGYALYIKNDHLVHDYNFVGNHFVVTSSEPVAAGTHSLRYELAKTGSHSGTGHLLIDGREVGTIDIPVMYRAQTSFIGMEIGSAPVPAVSDFPAPFRFTGTLRRVVVELGADQDVDEAGAAAAALRAQ